MPVELVLESYLIEGDRLHVKIQDEDDQLFKIRVLDPQNSNAEIPSAIFKRGFVLKTPFYQSLIVLLRAVKMLKEECFMLNFMALMILILL